MTSDDLEALSRREFGRLVALIARRIGAARIDVAEDAVQDAFAAAVRTWSAAPGPPREPGAWLYRAAWNRVLDRLRRLEPARLDDLDHGDRDPASDPGDSTAGDAELELILLSCHPALTLESQVALTLKIAAGFSTAEIGRLLGAEPDAVTQRLVRAKRSLRALGPAVATASQDRAGRAAAALEALYAMFSEGYASISAPSGLRRDLCFEALRLVRVMLTDPATATAEGHALAALFAFHGSRLGSRFDGEGAFRSLRDQDRSGWDRGLIAAGLDHLRRSAGGSLSRYHLEAEIASCHAVAARYQSTDWARIVALYDLLAGSVRTPAVRLNRAIAIGEWRGPEAGLEALAELREALSANPYYHAALADLTDRLGRAGAARAHYRRALATAWSPAVERVLAERLEDLARRDVGSGPAHPSSG